MEYWVDGYNLILRQGWTRAGATLDEARERLLRHVQALRAPARLYFDASRTGATVDRGRCASGGVRIVFVSRSSADDAMVNDLRGHRAPRDVTIVTSDRELRRRARQLGASTVGVEKFATRVAHANAPASRPPSRRAETGGRTAPLSDGEVDDWMNWFGYDGDDDEPTAHDG